jgi:hypothetical protein
MPLDRLGSPNVHFRTDPRQEIRYGCGLSPRPPVPSDAERCRAQAAKRRRRAKAADDVSMKNELLEIASYWDDLRSHYEAFERFSTRTSHSRTGDICHGLFSLRQDSHFA